MAAVATPGARSIAQVSEFLKVPATRCVKTLLVAASEGGCVALLLRGDHELNAVKAQKLPGIASPLRMASAAEVQADRLHSAQTLAERFGCVVLLKGSGSVTAASGRAPRRTRRSRRCRP